MSLRIAPAGHDAALYAVTRWHYSKSLPVPPRVILGVWEHDAFIGAVIFSRGASPALGRPYGLAAAEVAELTRVALRAHDAPVSQIVAAAIKWLRENNPGLRLLVSFADPAEGHHGGIYQAGNWTYCGTTTPSVAYVDKDGRKWHNRQVSSSGVRTQFGVVRKVVSTTDCTVVRTPGKHRYLLALDRNMRKRIRALAQPFPPRGGGLDSELPVVPTGGAGATPAHRSSEMAT